MAEDRTKSQGVDGQACCDDGCCGEESGSVAAEACCEDSCCGESGRNAVADDVVRESVREGYGAIARTGVWSKGETAEAGCCGAGGGCCGPSGYTSEQLAAAIGYDAQDLSATPDGANMGLSCGNPTAIAELREGEVVLDLGSGGGFDCFIAARRVGPRGRAIGVDMTPEMISKARKNQGVFRAKSGLNNAEFRLGEIENLPVADASVDVVISNCVLNLSPDKARVWKEIARVLKPGGRVAISDLGLHQPLPEAVRTDVEALVGCIAGASLVEETRAMAEAAGLREIEMRTSDAYVDAMERFNDPLYTRVAAGLGAGARVGDWVTSVEVRAVKG